jgi:hypothetical protein
MFLLVSMSIPIIFIYWDICKVKYALPFSQSNFKENAKFNTVHMSTRKLLNCRK